MINEDFVLLIRAFSKDHYLLTTIIGLESPIPRAECPR